MKRRYCLLFLFLFLLASLTAFCQKGVTGLQCEHLVNPIGVDESRPRLSWAISDNALGAVQTHYQIQVSANPQALAKGQADVWDSGKVASDSQLVTYGGAELVPFTKYYWRVTCWDTARDKQYSSAINTFETGMMLSANWQGRWITDTNSINYKPAPYFRKEIVIAKKVKSARVYIAVAGLYEFSVNGEKIGNRLLDPMYTRFDKRNLYTTFDITSQLKKGANAFGMLLGNGWYNHQSHAVWYFDRAPWRNRPRCCVNIRITYDDNLVETIATDELWKTADSPVVFNSIYTAEHYDARKEMQGWNAAGFDDSRWLPATVTEQPSGNVVAQQLCPIRVVTRLTAAKVNKVNDSCYVFSFPRNIAGVVEVNVQGKAGTVLRIKHGERLYDNGRVDQSNIDLHYRPKDNTDPFQTDIFTLSGRKDRFSPKFNYKGFQYVEVQSTEPIKLTAQNVIALEMHSDVPSIGRIHSSNPVLNKLWQATNSSYLANLFGYPTDCPQREKNGWTGDSHIAIETGLYGFDAITVYEKWLADFQDEQRPNGVLPNIIPTSGWGYDWANGPDWTSAVAIIPWQVYQFYGDSRLLYRMYDNIKRYVDNIHSISPNDTTNWGLGDWVPVKTVSSKTLTSSLYYYADVCILAKAAALFGKTNDTEQYTALAERIKQAINKNFLNRETGIYCSGSQTELAAPLYWGIVPDELKAKVALNLYNKLAETDFHIDTGILGAKALLNALSENGYADIAYRVALQKTFPSWGHWIEQGATTLYENWRTDAAVNDASLNHIMFGDINAWMYKGIGGIYPDEAQPGFKHILLKPNFINGLDTFEASHRSPYGTIVSKWTRVGNKVIYEAVIPANSSATLYLPNGKIQRLASGKHRVEVR